MSPQKFENPEQAPRKDSETPEASPPAQKKLNESVRRIETNTLPLLKESAKIREQAAEKPPLTKEEQNQIRKNAESYDKTAKILNKVISQGSTYEFLTAEERQNLIDVAKDAEVKAKAEWAKLKILNAEAPPRQPREGPIPSMRELLQNVQAEKKRNELLFSKGEKLSTEAQKKLSERIEENPAVYLEMALLHYENKNISDASDAAYWLIEAVKKSPETQQQQPISKKLLELGHAFLFRISYPKGGEAYGQDYTQREAEKRYTDSTGRTLTGRLDRMKENKAIMGWPELKKEIMETIKTIDLKNLQQDLATGSETKN